MRIGVDTGGTFTDIVAFDPRTGAIVTHKVSSTPHNPAQAVLRGVQEILAQTLTEPQQVQYLVHGTTVATNAVLTGNWAKTALITTKGFRDVLEIGRQNRPELYNFFTQKPEPVVPRDRRFELDERLDYQGKVLTPLDESAIVALAEAIKQTQAKCVAVVFLFSYLNPEHERTVKKKLASKLDIPIVLSSDTLPEFREFERTSTTVLNAALVPVVHQYLSALDEQTARLGIHQPWRIMQSNAGITSASFAASMPVSLLLSGPAGGVQGARFVGEQTGQHNLITLDMGGTSCDVALIPNGKPTLSSEGQIGGRPLRTPMVDMETIGAGGGSLAWIDEGRALRVGPQSAGADPGPVCYGRGGTQPTVTDAQLVLGRFNSNAPLGDIQSLDAERATNAIIDTIAKPLGMTMEQAASGILAVADAHMERAIRLVSIERGHDPRNFALLGFGGAGPLHTSRLAQQLDIPTVIVPNSAGVLSAFGLLTADLVHTFVRTILQPGSHLNWELINSAFSEFRSQGSQRLAGDGIKAEKTTFQPSMDVRYLGQSFEINVPVANHQLHANDLEPIAADFHELHEQLYGYHDANEPLEVVNLRMVVTGAIEKPAFLPHPNSAPPQPTGTRAVYFEQVGWTDCAVYERETVLHPAQLDGPALLEGKESTVVVYPHQRLRADEFGHLILTNKNIPSKENHNEPFGGRRNA